MCHSIFLCCSHVWNASPTCLLTYLFFFISHSFLSVHHVYDKTELYITELSLHQSSKRPVYTLWGGQRDSALGLGWHHSPFCKMTLFPCLLYVMQSLSAPCYFCGYISVNLPNTQYSLWSSALPPFLRQKGTDFEFDFGPAEVIFANIIAKLDHLKYFLLIIKSKKTWWIRFSCCVSVEYKQQVRISSMEERADLNASGSFKATSTSVPNATRYFLICQPNCN